MIHSVDNVLSCIFPPFLRGERVLSLRKLELLFFARASPWVQPLPLPYLREQLSPFFYYAGTFEDNPFAHPPFDQRTAADPEIKFPLVHFRT